MLQADPAVFGDQIAARAAFDAVSARCVLDLIADAAACAPNAPALTMLNTADPDAECEVIDFRTVHQRVVQVANWLRAQGVQPGRSVAVLMPLVPESLYAIFGASTAGCALPINYLLSVDHIVELLESVDCEVLIAYGEKDEFDIWNKAMQVRQRCRSLRRIVRVGGPHDEADTTVTPFARVLQTAALTLQFQPPGRTDIAAHFHTGGTTGAPKLARHTQENQVFAAWASVQINGYAAGTSTLAGMPLFHVAGSLLLSLASLAAGAHTVMLTRTGLRNKEVIAGFWKLVDRHRPRMIGFPPTGVIAVTAVETAGADLSSVVFCSSGGASLPAEAAARFERTFDIPIREAYGMTETAGLIAYTPWFMARRPKAVGIAVPCMEVRVVPEGQDADTATPLPPGQRGVIVARGPNVFAGYVDSRRNAGTLTPGGWVITGDLGHLDDEGYVFVTGRAKDLIIRGGHNIDPLDIESAAAMHPGIAQCAAIGQPDSYAGEVPVLYVTLKPGHDVSPGELLDFVGTRVAETPARPRRVTILPELPTTAVGKIFKPALRLHATQSVLEAELQRLGVQGRWSVSVADDPQRGLVARIALDGVASLRVADIRNALAPYPVHSELDVEASHPGRPA